MNLRKIIGTALSGVVVAGTVSVFAAPVAGATTEYPSMTAQSYVDSAAPGDTLQSDWDAGWPVGARVTEGTTHVSKTYVTFDLSGVTGVQIASARLSASEQSIANCKKNRASTQAWLTDTATAPTWANQPTEQLKLPTPVVYDTCGRGSLSWNATTALRRALHDGRTSVTFALRLSDAQQADPAFARSYDNVNLVVDTDQPPDTATYLSIGDRQCGADPVYVDTLNPRMAGNTTDPEYDPLAVRFEWWPTAHPGQKQHLDLTGVSAGGETDTYFPADLVENTAYTWHMRVSDGYNAGQWSATCSFIPDATRPSAAPTVSSADYPSESTGPGHGGSGIPGTFTFTASGVSDVVSYGWQFDQMSGFVDAPQPGGPVTLQLTPDVSGWTQLLVYSYDRAGNRSPAADYRFWVTDNSPTVSCTPQSAFMGQPRQCTVTPGSPGVTGYVYTLDYGNPDVPVPANPDGTAAFTFTPRSTNNGETHVYVRATLEDGRRSDPAEVVLDTDGGQPVVDVPPPPVPFGAPVQITMHAKLPDSRTFTYEWNYEGEHTVPVGPDGTATITVQPNGSGYFYLFVHTTDGSGLQSWSTTTQVQVASNRPVVTSTTYPGEYGGATGVEGTFVFSSPVPGAASYTYHFNDDSPVTVPAGADGTASVRYTPQHRDSNYLTVRTTFTDGSTSEELFWSFMVNGNGPDVQCTPFEVPAGGEFTCTLAPVQVGAQSYRYQWGDGPEQVLPMSPDGTATVTLTMPVDGDYYQTLSTWSTDGSGVRSDVDYTSIYRTGFAASPRGTRVT